MSTLNVGAMAARLGLDPSDFLDKMKGVEGFASASNQRIAAEMKRTSREGAESLRLIDEALGIHLSRPVTRIISQEFPALANALSSVLGGAVFGVVAIAGVEAFEKIEKAIRNAEKAEEDLRAAQQKLADFQAHMSDSWQEKINKLSFKPEQTIDSEGASEALQKVKELGAKVEEEQKKAQAAAVWYNQMWHAIEKGWESFTGKSSDLAKKDAKDFEDLRRSIEDAFTFDQINGTDTVLKKIDALIDSIQGKLIADVPTWNKSVLGWNETLKAQLDFLNSIKTGIEGVRQAWQKAQEAADTHKAAIEQQKKLVEDMARFSKGIEEGYAKLHPQTDPFQKMITEVADLRMKAENDFTAIAAAGANAFELRLARQRLQEYEADLDRIAKKAQQDLNIEQLEKALPKLEDLPKLSGFPALPAASQEPPTLARPQRSDLAELAKMQDDWNEKLKTAAEILDKIETPREKYQAGLATLNLLEHDGLITTEQRTAAEAQLNEELVKEETHVRQLQKELQKLLENSQSAADGYRAFLTQIKITSDEEGKFVFDALTEAWKGAEGNIATSLVDVLENYRNKNQKLMQELARMWEHYFASLSEMAIKHSLDKAFGGLIEGLGKPKGIPGLEGGPPLVNGQIPEAGSKAVGAALQAPAASLQSAANLLTEAAVALKASAAALQSSAGGGGGGIIPGVGGDGTAAGGASADSGGIAAFAAGGDAEPGSSFIAGEAGEAEMVSLGAGGGAHVQPLGWGPSKGDSHYYDFRGAVVTDDLVRKAEMSRAMAITESRMVHAIPSIQREINLRKRPG